MKEKYRRKVKSLPTVITRKYKEGDQIALRRPRPGKLKDDAEQGFKFIRYMDESLGTAQVIKISSGRISIKNIEDLILLDVPVK